MPIYMKYEGIKGNVTEKDHAGWIELTSAQFGIARTTSREKTESSPSEVVVGKDQNDVSALLFQESISGQPRKVTIHFVELNDGKPRVYLNIELEGVMISAYQISGHGGTAGRPGEFITLNFIKIIYSAIPAAVPKQGANKTNKSMWDLALAKQP